MSSRHHIDDFMRGRIIGKIEEGRKITDVAREFDIAHSVVSRLWKSFKTTGICSRRHGGGRVRSTTPAEDRYIVLSAKKNRRTTAQQVANQFLAASGKQISRKTVARRLRGGGLYARRPVVCVPLTRQHRTVRLQWCREHHIWTEQDWACVLFSDESRFSLSSDCRRQLIWRESGTAYRPENIQEKDRYPTCSILVWAGIMINGRTRLHVVANGTMTGQRYIDEVLLPHVRLFRGAVGDKFVFMDDNATYLNPIENVWDALGRQVAGRNYPPTNKNTLIRALTEEWDKLPQQLLDNVVQSMPVDCAGYLGTDNRRDQCGVCRGDNSTCVKYQNTFWRRPRGNFASDGRKDRHYDYNEILTIPDGATRIVVSEASDTNFLVLVDSKNNFFINGNWRVQSPGRFLVHGSEFVYNRTWDGRENLSSDGPTRLPLSVQQRFPLRYNDNSMGAWRSLGDRAKLSSFFGDKVGVFVDHFGDLVIKLTTIFGEFGTLWILLEISREIH
ncbi:a disintegrin and metalloproteinase with thrombospondin motifs 16 [Trichonephila clavipes]|nr:a disintegrin and metalloproteinase with thrombospondin motifs 16 [Trichonephila clavipes]